MASSKTHRSPLLALDLDAAGFVIIAMSSPHRIPYHLVRGTGVWVASDAEHNRANLLAWCIANRNQAAVRTGRKFGCKQQKWDFPFSSGLVRGAERGAGLPATPSSSWG
jgi:hypothetical protein